MGFSKYQIFLTALMLLSGTIATLTAKLSDEQTAAYRNGIKYSFSHPFFQALCMFIGEALCFFVYELLYRLNRHKLDYTEITDTSGISIKSMLAGNRDFNPFIFLPASICDMCATSCAYFGLNLTYASSYQMLTGATMIFTGLLSVAFLGSKLQANKWCGIFLVVGGLVTIGVSDFVYSDTTTNTDVNGIIAGDLFILVGLVLSSGQMVYEEKFISKYNIPALKAIGWEGIFGTIVLSILLVPMYFIQIPALSKDDPDHRLENVPDALHQMGSNPVILVAVLGNLLAIGVLNFASISVTKEISATTRVVLGNLRTIAVWAISLALSWQKFYAIQLLGFTFLIVGTFVYNNIVFVPLYQKYMAKRNFYTKDNTSESAKLINSDDDA